MVHVRSMVVSFCSLESTWWVRGTCASQHCHLEGDANDLYIQLREQCFSSVPKLLRHLRTDTELKSTVLKCSRSSNNFRPDAGRSCIVVNTYQAKHGCHRELDSTWKPSPERLVAMPLIMSSISCPVTCLMVGISSSSMCCGCRSGRSILVFAGLLLPDTTSRFMCPLVYAGQNSYRSITSDLAQGISLSLSVVYTVHSTKGRV